MTKQALRISLLILILSLASINEAKLFSKKKYSQSKNDNAVIGSHVVQSIVKTESGNVDVSTDPLNYLGQLESYNNPYQLTSINRWAMPNNILGIGGILLTEEGSSLASKSKTKAQQGMIQITSDGISISGNDDDHNSNGGIDYGYNTGIGSIISSPGNGITIDSPYSMMTVGIGNNKLGKYDLGNNYQKVKLRKKVKGKNAYIKSSMSTKTYASHIIDNTISGISADISDW